jgi:N-acetylglutamate synthase-like GNAT family acetyltransferase
MRRRTMFEIRPAEQRDRDWVAQFLTDQWGSPCVVSRGRVHSAELLPGFIGVTKGERVGLITYRVDGKECEIVTLDSTIEDCGMGTALIAETKLAATTEGCKRLWLVTSNDNMKVLRFYQKRGFQLAALYSNALNEARKLKPEIPLVGIDGIPLRDEIELELCL